MKAIVQDQYGEANVLHLEDIDAPTAGTGEVLLKVEAASLFAGDWHYMAGMPLAFRPASGLTKPKIRVRGRDVAGPHRGGRPGRGNVPGRRCRVRHLRWCVRRVRGRRSEQARSEAN